MGTSEDYAFDWALDACEAPRDVQYELINQSISLLSFIPPWPWFCVHLVHKLSGRLNLCLSDPCLSMIQWLSAILLQGAALSGDVLDPWRSTRPLKPCPTSGYITGGLPVWRRWCLAQWPQSSPLGSRATGVNLWPHSRSASDAIMGQAFAWTQASSLCFETTEEPCSRLSIPCPRPLYGRGSGACITCLQSWRSPLQWPAF